MAKDGPGGEKTEPATAKKLSDARSEGQVAKSKSLGDAIMLIMLFLILRIFIPSIGQGLLEGFYLSYGKIGDLTSHSNQNFTVDGVHTIVVQFVLKILLILLPLFAIGVLVSFIVDVVQVKWKVTTKPLQPKFSKLNPVNGIKRIFSTRALVELAKSVAIIIVIGIYAYNLLKDRFIFLFHFYQVGVMDCIVFIGDMVLDLGLKLSAVMLVIGLSGLCLSEVEIQG